MIAGLYSNLTWFPLASSIFPLGVYSSEGGYLYSISLGTWSDLYSLAAGFYLRVIWISRNFIKL